MKKAKKYIGRKLLLTVGEKNSITYFEKSQNTIRSFEEFKNDVENDYYTSIELLKDNIELYKCQTFKTSNLAKLKEIRDTIEKKGCTYNELFTKEEIIELLKDDYIVCVEGFKEINLENIDIL